MEAGRDSLAVVTGEGWLMKKSSGLFPRWQRRYFRVGGIFLRYYYGDDGASGAAFALDLTEKDLEVVIDCTSALDFDLRRRTANGSTVIVSLRAESEQERRQWVRAIVDAGVQSPQEGSQSLGGLGGSGASSDTGAGIAMTRISQMSGMSRPSAPEMQTRVQGERPVERPAAQMAAEEAVETEGEGAKAEDLSTPPKDSEDFVLAEIYLEPEPHNIGNPLTEELDDLELHKCRDSVGGGIRESSTVFEEPVPAFLVMLLMFIGVVENPKVILIAHSTLARFPVLRRLPSAYKWLMRLAIFTYFGVVEVTTFRLFVYTEIKGEPNFFYLEENDDYLLFKLCYVFASGIFMTVPMVAYVWMLKYARRPEELLTTFRIRLVGVIRSLMAPFFLYSLLQTPVTILIFWAFFDPLTRQADDYTSALNDGISQLLSWTIPQNLLAIPLSIFVIVYFAVGPLPCLLEIPSSLMSGCPPIGNEAIEFHRANFPVRRGGRKSGPEHCYPGVP